MDYEKYVNDFFLHIRPYQEGFPTQSIRFLALKTPGNFTLVKGRLFYHNSPILVNTRIVETNSIIAGEFDLRTLDLKPEELIDKVLLGTIPTPRGILNFSAEKSGLFSVSFNPFHQEGIDVQKRISILEIKGEDHPVLERSITLSWELMAADTPYVHVNELANDFHLGQLQIEKSVFEVVATHVAEIDNNSMVNGENAKIGVMISNKLDRSKTKINYRVINRDQTVTRSSISGEYLEWREINSDVSSGFGQINILPKSVIQAFAVYNNSTQHYWWFSDNNHMPNERRVVYELYDPDLTIMTEIFSKRLGRGNAHDLEAAASWLLWLLGFDVALLGITSRTQDAPDLVAFTPSGHIAVIECTTGILKTDNKLSHLVSRCHQIRDRLIEQGILGTRVLALMFTTKAREEISVDLEQAERHNVLVLAKEDLLDAIFKTLQQPDADAVFAEAEREMQSNLAKYSRS